MTDEPAYDPVKDIQDVRDRVTAMAIDQTRGHSRELSFCMGKLDEARQWALAYQEARGAYVTLPRQEILRTVATHKTLAERDTDASAV